jgi:hypothetical protein
VGMGKAKIGSLGINRSHEMHVGRIPSNLMAKFNLGLTLQVFETLGRWCKFLNFWVKIEKPLKLQQLKVNLAQN